MTAADTCWGYDTPLRVCISLPPVYTWQGDDNDQSVTAEQYTFSAHRVSALPSRWSVTLVLYETDKGGRRVGWFQVEEYGSKEEVVRLVEQAAEAAGMVNKGLVS